MLNKNKKKLKQIYEEEFQKAYEKAKVEELANEINRLKAQARKDAKIKAAGKYKPKVKKLKNTGKKLQSTGKKVAKASKKIKKHHEDMVDSIMGW